MTKSNQTLGKKVTSILAKSEFYAIIVLFCSLKKSLSVNILNKIYSFLSSFRLGHPPFVNKIVIMYRGKRQWNIDR